MSLANILAGLILLALAWMVVHEWRTRPETDRKRGVLLALSRFSLGYGLACFLLPLASASGYLSFIPGTFEWPLGNAEEVIRDNEGNYIAAHFPSGRIQVYDADKNYLTGWPFENGGRSFQLSLTDDGLILVRTSYNNIWTYTYDGDEVVNSSSVSSKEPITSYPFGITFGYPFILFPLTHPLIAFFLFAGGMVGNNYFRDKNDTKNPAEQDPEGSQLS